MQFCSSSITYDLVKQVSIYDDLVSSAGPACLRFFYNMNGRGIGTLNVFAGESNSEQNVWNISGNQNDIWTPVAVDIPPVNDLVVFFLFMPLNKQYFIIWLNVLSKIRISKAIKLLFISIQYKCTKTRILNEDLALNYIIQQW